MAEKKLHSQKAREAVGGGCVTMQGMGPMGIMGGRGAWSWGWASMMRGEVGGIRVWG